MLLGDCLNHLNTMPKASVEFSVFSPPFLNLYSYTASERDLGNQKTREDFFNLFDQMVRLLLNVMKPGRIAACHVAQVPMTLVDHGEIGLRDFRGWTIAAFIRAGWVHHGEVVIDKDPQAQAIRTKTKGLLFVQLRKDSSWLRPALADFLLLFRKPGDNAEAIHGDITNDEWIKFAHPIWYDIDETDVLSGREAREEKDEKHICPLQLGLIDRAVRLWSNPGDVVLSPFAGIGSEGYQSILRGRNFVGIELKRSYYEQACRNLATANTKANEGDLFAVGVA